MSNDLSVDIVAIDKTAAGVKSAKQTLKGVHKDLQALSGGKGTFADFSKNLKSNLAGDKAQAVLGQLGKIKGGGNLLEVARNFGQAAEAAEALAGTMGVLGVATGGVVAGLGAAGAAAYAFSKPWMKGAANIGQLSMALGIATRDLQLFEGAAARMGVTKDQADQALGGLGDAAHAALYSPAGGQQRAMFGALGIDVHKFADKSGHVDLPALMQRVADGVQAQGNAQAQAHVAQALGVSSALPALRQGSGWLRSNMRSMASLGYYSDEDVARGMLGAQNDVLLGQYGKSQVRRLRGFVAKHGVTQSLDVAAGGLSAYVGAPQSKRPTLDALNTSSSINAARVQPIHLEADPSLAAAPQLIRPNGADGLSSALPAVQFAAVVQGKFAPAADKLLSGADKIERLFEQGGLNRYAAVGMTAGFSAETGGTFDPQQRQRGGGPGLGLGQWEKPRQGVFKQWSGHSMQSASQEEEVAFALWELKHGSRNNQLAGRKLSAVDSYGDAGEIASRWYEGPANADGQARHRRQLSSEMGASLDSTGHIKVDVHLHDHRTRVKTEYQDTKGRIHVAMQSQWQEAVQPSQRQWNPPVERELTCDHISP